MFRRTSIRARGRSSWCLCLWMSNESSSHRLLPRGAAARTRARSPRSSFFESRLLLGWGGNGVEVALHALPWTDDAFLRVFDERPIFGPLPAERVPQHVVAFVALVRQHRLVSRPRRQIHQD